MTLPSVAQPASIGLSVVLFVGAALVYRAHVGLPYSEPKTTAGALFSAGGTGDAESFKAASTAEFYGSFVAVFGAAKYERVQQIFALVERLGTSRWLEVRQRAVSGALAAREVLLERAIVLGRAELNKLPVDQRLQLLDQQGGNAFIALGLEALPAAERRLIPDVEAFQSGRDRGAFTEAQLWDYASAEDKKLLGTAAALSLGESTEKTVFLDRAGVPLLPANLRAELGAIQRSELDDPGLFKFKHGEEWARGYIEREVIPAIVVVEDCRFPRQDRKGGLLRGQQSSCTVLAPVPGQGAPLALVVELQKIESRWLVSGVSPAFHSAWPPRPER